MTRSVNPTGAERGVPEALRARRDRARRKAERLARRRPRNLLGPAGPLAVLWGMVRLRDRAAFAQRARLGWRRALQRRARARAEFVELEARIQLIASTRVALADFLGSGARLSVSSHGQAPDISVIIVVWNQAHFLLACLRALLAEPVRPSIEVIVVDNASGAETQALLSRFDGATVIRNRENVGFLLACNQGAAQARGRAILLLNSDAFVRSGALAAAMSMLESEPDVGAVGGRLILPSGRLQEAGCEATPGGVTRGRSRGRPPEAPEAMVGCDVDYCSGAFLMTRSTLWRQLGGFDAAYAPGYYEEADFCLRLKAAGFRIVFEPKVAVDHVELGSQARTGDAARLSARNQAIFAARHAQMLRGRTRLT